MNDSVKYPPLDCESISNDLERSENLNRKSCKRGFTLIEIAIVIAIIGTLSAIAVPQYFAYKKKAEIVVAITDIRMLEKQINLYVVDNEGQLPNSLDDLPTMGGPPKDPWGRPYRYLKIAGAPVVPVDPGKPAALGKPVGAGAPENEIAIGGARKNMMDAPVNQDYDLYSMGKDGQTNFSFKAPVSWDDVVRAYEGQYVGLVSEL